MDAIFGGTGNDDIDGGSGNDILVGGDGRDEIKGGRGKDLLIGGIVGNNFADSSILDDIDAAMAEWANGDYMYTLGLLGPVIDDHDKDRLFGEQDKDKLYGGSNDYRKD